MGYMKHLSMMLSDGDSVEEIASWIVKVNMERNSHITYSDALTLAEQYKLNYNGE
jgi:hypothetical protein|tara:strand:- start:857 stop:1021 length:165 start_codon:yes stop_codon:yes gene_type:complete